MRQLPIVFINYSNSDFLKLAILQARHFNPDCDIILLGDESNRDLKGICTHLLYKNFTDSSKKLESLYQHFSTNSYEIELFCIKRWFILFEYMKANELEWVFTADSDVLLYSSINNYFNENFQLYRFCISFC